MYAHFIPRLLAPIILLSACGTRPVSLDDYNTRAVTLPNGAKIRAEVMVHSEDMMRGMMFRESLEADRGMLFIHGEEGNYTYWMYKVKIPLDILWLDARKRIVEISTNTPPCPSKASDCPHYGGTQKALYILELAAGSAARHGLRVGAELDF
jgi:uncharacterized membrane protein (UPF0127 family)